MLIDDVNEILSHSIDDIIKSSMSLKLFKVYSLLYLGGRQPRGICERSQRIYYNQIKIDGMEKAKKAEKVISRTCKPKFNGLRYIPSIMKGGKLIAVHKHIDSGNISDQEALDLLDAGILKESDFEVLPEKYASKKQKAKQSKKS